MSLDAMKAVWGDRTVTDTNEAFVLVILADFCNEQMCCWPSVSTIASRARMSLRGVQAVIGRLKDKKKVEVIQSEGGSKGSTNCYRLTYLPPQPVQGSNGHTPAAGAGVEVRTPAATAGGPPQPVHPPPQLATLTPAELLRTIPKRSLNDPPCDPPERTPAPTAGVEKTFEGYRVHLFAMYGRKNSEAMTYIERSSLAELIRIRPDFSLELEEIEAFKQVCPGRFFPQTLSSLVEGWQRTLDRSRTRGVNDADMPAHVRLKAIDREIEQHPANRESAHYRSDCPVEKRQELKELRQKRDQVNRRIALG